MIILIRIFAELIDNLGYGEVGCYCGGMTRSAPTPRIDKLAPEGRWFTNMNMETQCTPGLSSLMTGRWAIRSGTHSVPFGGVAVGMTQWEVTIAEVFSEVGYTTTFYCTWHLGSSKERLPDDQSLDEWSGIPKATEETPLPSAAEWSHYIMPAEKSWRVGEARRVWNYNWRFHPTPPSCIAESRLCWQNRQ